jgi:DNA primase
MNRRDDMNSEVDALKRNSLGLYRSRLHGRTDGNRYRATCPFHQDSNPSLDVYSYRGVHLHKCLACGAVGNIFQFLQRLDGITFPEAVEVVKQYLGLTHGSRTHKVPTNPTPIALPEKPKAYKTFSLAEYGGFELALARNNTAHEWLRNKRGISLETAQRLHFGYRQSITSKVAELQDVLDKGWISFPSIEGEIVTCIKYRSLHRKAFSRQFGMATALFNAQVIDPLDDLFVTEGEFDCAVLCQCGLKAVSIGSTTTPITTKMLAQLKQAKRCVLAGDSDDLGIKKMQELGQQIAGSCLLQWPNCKDANELWLQDQDVEGFRERVIGLVGEAEKGTA